LNPGYFKEISDGLAAAGQPVHHFLLHVGEDELARRITADTGEPTAKDWRLKHIVRYQEALPWLTESATVIDTTEVPAAKVAQDIAFQLANG
jgi:hypothetical protein